MGNGNCLLGNFRYFCCCRIQIRYHYRWYQDQSTLIPFASWHVPWLCLWCLCRLCRMCRLWWLYLNSVFYYWYRLLRPQLFSLLLRSQKILDKYVLSQPSLKGRTLVWKKNLCHEIICCGALRTCRLNAFCKLEIEMEEMEIEQI